MSFDDINLNDKITDHDNNVLLVVYKTVKFMVTLNEVTLDTDVWERGNLTDASLMDLWKPLSYNNLGD